jgi:hypothetical protein
MKGAGFFRRVFSASLAFAGMGGLKPQPVATSHSSVQANVPQPTRQAPTPTGISVRKMQDRVIRSSNVWRGYARSHVIPPFKFAHGRTMVARYPRLRGS